MPDGECDACYRLGAELCAQCADEVLSTRATWLQEQVPLADEQRRGQQPPPVPYQIACR